MSDWEVESQTPVAAAAPQANPWAVVEHKPIAPQATYAQDVQRLIQNPGQVALEDIKSIPSSLLSGAKALGGRVAEDVGGIVAGKPQQAAADALSVIRKINPITGAIDAVRQGIADPEAAARVVADPAHPVQSALNALSIGSSGKLSAVRGALQAGTTGVKLADMAGTLPVAALSGVGPKSQLAASRAGVLGGAEGAGFRGAMRGSLSGDEVVGRMLDAADQLAVDKNAARAADAAKWNIPGAMADISGVHKALADAVDANKTSIGATRNQQAAAALSSIGDVLDKHTTIPSHGGFGPTKVAALGVEDTDALKQAIGEIMFNKDMAPKGSVASVLAQKVYDAAKGAISDVSPQYASAMERNQADIRNLQNIRREFSLKPGVSPGTVLTKIQSAMRNDVSSKFGYRGELLKQLAAKDPSIPYAAAGQDFSAWMPRGLAKVADTGLAGLALLHNPAALAAAPVTIPRLVGEARYGAGSTVRGARALGATQPNLGLASTIGLLGTSDQQRKGLLSP